MSSDTDSALVGWYRDRIADPGTADEARGYWLFVLGVLAGIAGILLFLTGSPRTTAREAGIALAAAGLVLVLIGPIVRLPLRSRATSLAYLGAVVCGAAIAWFLVAFPANWSPTGGQPTIIGLYAVGLLVIALGGIFVPVLSGAPARGATDEAADEPTETASEEGDLAAELEALRTSQARFELYEDGAGEWRWRLRHRNGNVIADSGEGYADRTGARDGVESVKRNAPGADVEES